MFKDIEQEIQLYAGSFDSKDPALRAIEAFLSTFRLLKRDTLGPEPSLLPLARAVPQPRAPQTYTPPSPGENTCLLAEAADLKSSPVEQNDNLSVKIGEFRTGDLVLILPTVRKGIWSLFNNGYPNYYVDPGCIEEATSDGAPSWIMGHLTSVNERHSMGKVGTINRTGQPLLILLRITALVAKSLSPATGLPLL